MLSFIYAGAAIAVIGTAQGSVGAIAIAAPADALADAMHAAPTDVRIIGTDNVSIEQAEAWTRPCRITLPKKLPLTPQCAWTPLRPQRRSPCTRAVPGATKMDEERLVMTIKPDVLDTHVLMTRGRDEVLRAVLAPPSQMHCRAAPTLAEAMALWYQRRLSVVLYADVSEERFAIHLCDGLGFGVQNVHYDVSVLIPGNRGRGRRLGGKGKFSDLRRLCLRGNS